MLYLFGNLLLIKKQTAAMVHFRTQALSAKIRTTQELGSFVKQCRRAQKILQIDVAGLADTGNRFVVDLEKGKPTLQLQKVLDVLDLLRLEVIVQRKGQ